MGGKAGRCPVDSRFPKYHRSTGWVGSGVTKQHQKQSRCMEAKLDSHHGSRITVCDQRVRTGHREKSEHFSVPETWRDKNTAGP